MSDQVLMEEPLQFGQNGRLFGILSQPTTPANGSHALPVFVFLSSGITHRVGPRRLYVRLARKLAEIGFTSLRVDLTGKGDSYSNKQLSPEELLMEDFKDIVSVLETRQTQLQLVVCGLCSGADDAIKVTPTDPRVVGMVLLDPVCDRDNGFKVRDIIHRYTQLARYKRRLKKIFSWHKMFKRSGPEMSDAEAEQLLNPLEMRDFPSHQQLREAFQLIHQRKGRVFSIFTSYALDYYYNQHGQMERVLGLDDYKDYCVEHFWPGASHTYSLETHRARLVEEIKMWATAYIQIGRTS